MTHRQTLVVLTVLSLVSAPAVHAAPVEYKNPELKFSTRVPSDWKPKQRAIEQGTSVSFMSPTEKNDKFSENVSVVVKVLPRPDMDLPGFSNYIDKNIKSLAGLKVIRSGESNMAGLPAREIVYTAKVTTKGAKVIDRVLQHYKRWVVKNGKGYVVSFVALPQTYDKLYHHAEVVANSLKLD